MDEAFFAAAPELVLLFVICLIVALGTSAFLYRLFSRWGLGRISVAASAPLPGVALVLCSFVFVRAAMATTDQCGIDACGMAEGFSLILGIWSVVIFGLSAGICYGILRAMDRRK